MSARTTTRLAVLLAATLAAAACSIRRLELAPEAKVPPPLPAALAAPFDYARAAVEPKLERLEDEATHEKLRGTYEAPCPAGNGARPVTFEFWRTKRGEGRRPVVIIVPILAGRYPECDHLGRLMARNGMHAFFVHREDDLLKLEGASEPFEAKLRRSIVGIRRTLDWAAARPDVAPDKVGLVGISMGAITGTIVLAVEPRVKRGVLIMGGCDIPGIVCDSIETPVRRWKVHKMRENGWTEDEFKAAVARELPSDPARYAPYVGARRVQQYIALYDNKVPTPYQWKLWRALGEPQGFAIPIGHYTSILYLGFAEEHAMAFMCEGLLGNRASEVASATSSR